MTATFIPLASISTTGNTESVTFNSITNVYRDLVLIGHVNRGTNGATNIRFRFNGDTGTNYRFIQGEGYFTANNSFNRTAQDRYSFSGETWSLPRLQGSFILNLIDYSATDRHKSILARAGDAEEGVGMSYGRYESNSAISSIQITTLNSTFTMGTDSFFYLYGIAG